MNSYYAAHCSVLQDRLDYAEVGCTLHEINLETKLKIDLSEGKEMSDEVPLQTRLRLYLHHALDQHGIEFPKESVQG